MEQVALNNVQLDYLAREGPVLKLHFYRTLACDRLPKKPLKTQPQAYIVNTDPITNPENIGWVCGPRETCVKSWTVTPCPWKSTSKPPL